MQALSTRSSKTNKSIPTLLHKQLNDRLRKALNRNVDFAFTFGVCDDIKTTASIMPPPPLWHAHGVILLNEEEQDGRTRTSQKLRSALRDKSFCITSAKLKDSVYIQTKTESDYWHTYYGCDLDRKAAALAAYFQKNENEVNQQAWAEKQAEKKLDVVYWGGFYKTHAASKNLAGTFQAQKHLQRAKATVASQNAKREQIAP